jgi:hypothetical protein
MFVLSWIGEWEPLPEPTRTWIFITDIFAGSMLAFRFLAGILAFSATTFYIVKKRLSTKASFRILKIIIVFEALYWIGLLPSGIWGFVAVSGIQSAFSFAALMLFITSGLPCTVSGIAIPFALFKLASKLKTSESMKGPIKWGLVSGTIYILVFWLNNSSIWLTVLVSKGTEYITTHPENLLNFGLTIVGLLALTAFTAYFAKKSAGTETIEKLKIRTIGAIVLSLGMYFLWNYLAWIFFGGWSDWYAWFLGHNLDLWILALPLVGLPLLFCRQDQTLPQSE